MMDEELVEAGEVAHPTQPEEAEGWTGSQPVDQPAELPAFDHCDGAAFGEPRGRPGKDQARRGYRIALPQQEVSGELFGGP